MLQPDYESHCNAQEYAISQVDRRPCTGKLTQKVYVTSESPKLDLRLLNDGVDTNKAILDQHSHSPGALPPKIFKSFQIQTAHHDTSQQERLKRSGYRCRASPLTGAWGLSARSESQYRK
ncbi:Uncharacterized protein HZ326_13862 [Fusarium oxysporum f. sp. albedinis]|nr:Uncharacterized protein HZ326_13862 [Fusarium oxysporum f. sp. albedinis]